MNKASDVGQGMNNDTEISTFIMDEKPNLDKVEHTNGRNEVSTSIVADHISMGFLESLNNPSTAATPLQQDEDSAMVNIQTPKSNGSASRRERKRANDSSFPMIEPQTSSRKKKKVSKKTEETSWICADCKEAEALDDPDADLLMCDGSCNRPFHNSCVGLKCLPDGEETWFCPDCKNGSHPCTICQEYGKDNVDVFHCKISGCGLYFHESCLSTYNVNVQLVPKAIDLGEATSGDESTSETKPVFKCPAHQCWTCTEEMVLDDEVVEDASILSSMNIKSKGKKGGKKKGKKKDNVFGTKKGALFRCLECPIAYHISCIPPFARFHELALLCHDHSATCKLPALDFETSVQGQIERKADEQLESFAKSKQSNFRKSSQNIGEHNIFFLGLRGDVITNEEKKLLSHVEEYVEETDKMAPSTLQDLMFCLPCDLKDEVHAKPPTYRAVHTPRYDAQNRPKRHDPSGDVCDCKASNRKSCDENCHNRMMFMECVGDSSKSNGAKNSYWNCDLGPNCGNRSIGLRKAAKCKPMREKGKGWGLIPLSPLKRGNLVQEYVGEVIDAKTKETRLKEWSKDHPNDPNFYIMQLEPGWFIDARVEANLSRFINHSCDPNCVLRPYNVSGYIRVGVFALRDIPPGEFLSYDYQFDTQQGDKFVCRCGAATCRGTMKGGKQNLEQGEDAKKTAKQLLAEAKAKEEKDRKYLEDAAKVKEARFSQVNAMIPGCQYPNETVALGPFDRYKSECRSNRIFLWRNAQLGSEFSDRAFRLGRKKTPNPKKLKAPKVDILATLAALNGCSDQGVHNAAQPASSL